MIREPKTYKAGAGPVETAGAGPGRRLLRVGGVLLVSLLLTSGCGIKAGISPKSHEVHSLFYIILWLALPVFLFVEGMLVLSLIRFRKRRGDEAEPPQFAGRNSVLYAFFAGPLIVVVILLAFGESTLGKVDKVATHPAQRVVVTGFQWAWQAQYQQGVIVTGKTLGRPLVMELPVDQQTQITLESRDVIHEFYVPDLLYMKNAVPGHPNTFSIQPTKVGTYRGQCAQYCGLWHAQMRLVVKVVPVSEFARWVHKEKAAAKAKAAKAACAPTGSTVSLTAQHITWDKSCLGVLAGKSFKITIVNKDPGIAHNFAIWQDSSLKKQLYQSGNVTGPATKTFIVPALPPGKYYFQCNIHGPAMSGTLVVGNAG